MRRVLHYFWKGFRAPGSDSDGLRFASCCWFSVAGYRRNLEVPHRIRGPYM